MSSSPVSWRTLRRVVPATALALVATPLALAAPAHAAGPGLVISEVYGSSQATDGYTHDFVELTNATSAPVELDGTSLQYRSASNSGANPPSGANVIPLSGTLAPGDTFLITGAAQGGTVQLPEADRTTSLNLSGTSGTVFLADQATGLAFPTGDATGVDGLIDLVGYGSSNTYEGGTAPSPSATTTIARDEEATDTDDNGEDFRAGAGTPDAPSEPSVEVPDDATIADIQGTGTTSPYVGQEATVRGVVTARYPLSAGGLNGFYVQTEGTGGDTDATPGASDALFVFTPSFDDSALALGDFVEVSGTVSEFNGLTEITAASGGVTVLDETPEPVTPLAAAYPTTAAEREAHEGELLAPTDEFVVSDVYDLNRYGEIGLATGGRPLVQPTEVEDAQTGDTEGVAADNAARGVVLDDGAALDFLSNDFPENKDIPLPWLAPENPVRVGAAVTLEQPVVLDFRNGTWKFQPSERVADTGAAVAEFENTRPANEQPQDVGGDIRLATFNVLNYFNTTGEDFVANGGSCTFYEDRAGDPVANNSCTPDGPRGAAEAEDLARQQQKIVEAINRLDAHVVSLEEIENSVKLLTETDRDDALAHLVEALNADAGAGTWAYAPSPDAADLPPLAEQDVIRTAFIYKPAAVELVGPSKVLVGEAAFGNAREPLAQAFKPVGGGDDQVFAAIVNHFKSKGSGTPDPDGQGNANVDRVAQAEALVDFADDFAAEAGTDRVFLTGDFNAYSKEDPIQVLEEAGYTNLESDTEGEETYSFDGLAGSLDHVLASPGALEMVTGVDVWEINANESVAFQYSRYNYNATQFFQGDNPFAASDHNPEIVGLDVEGGQEPATRDIQILGTNDFHGRLTNNPSGTEAGAAVLAGAVKQLRQQNPDTVFAAAGDLIGASTFDSFIQQDKPTIDALNEAGLEVSAVGNHEFDQGYADLVDRVMAEYDAEDNPYGGAEWQYIGANVKLKATGDPAVPATWIKEFGDVQVGFVGAVTEELPSLVSPAGIADLEVEDIVTSVNAEADALEAEGADVIVLLVHEGATSTDLASATDPETPFGEIVNGVDEDVDAIISGHTHLAYNHSIPVPEWVAEGRDVTERPVVSAGQYGSALNRLVFTVDTATGEVQAKTQEILALKDGQTPSFPADVATQAIVQAAVDEANVLGAEPLGEIAAPFNRAKLADGATENRGNESTLGNLVAEVHRWATETPEAGGAQIAFMNPGGLRADMTGVEEGDGSYPRTLTFRQAADVQPFANTLVNMDLTGADIKQVLEEQWQTNPGGPEPSRPFLRLGVSKGFTYTFDASRPDGDRITGMWLDGEPIEPGTSYSVTANSFLAAGGDNFRAFTNGTNTADTGKSDLTVMVEFMEAFASTEPLPADYSQRAVGISTEDGELPSQLEPGGRLAMEVSSWSMSTEADTKDSEIEVLVGDRVVGTVPVDNTVQAELPGYDETGTASIDLALPGDLPAGDTTLTLRGAATGTTVVLPVTVESAGAEASVSLDVSPPQPIVGKTPVNARVRVTAEGGTPTGTVELLVDGVVRATATVKSGTTVIKLPPFTTAGEHTLQARYLGDDATAPAESEVVTVTARTVGRG